MAFMSSLADYFQPTARHEPAGGDWRDVPNPDAEYQRRISEGGWKLDGQQNVVVPIKPIPKYSPQENSDEIERLNYLLASIKGQIAKLEDEQKTLRIERTAQIAMWVEHSEKIQVLDAIRKAMAQPNANEELE